MIISRTPRRSKMTAAVRNSIHATIQTLCWIIMAPTPAYNHGHHCNNMNGGRYAILAIARSRRKSKSEEEVPAIFSSLPSTVIFTSFVPFSLYHHAWTIPFLPKATLPGGHRRCNCNRCWYERNVSRGGGGSKWQRQWRAIINGRCSSQRRQQC